MQNLLELNQPALAQFFAQLGEKPASVKMRAKQTLKWLHQSQVTDFSAMTDIAKATRELLAAKMAAIGIVLGGYDGLVFSQHFTLGLCY